MNPELIRYARNLIEVKNLVPVAEIKHGKIVNEDEIVNILFRRVEDRIIRYGTKAFMEEIIKRYINDYNIDEGLIKTNSDTKKFLYYMALKKATDSNIKEETKNKRGSLSIGVIDKIAETLLNLFPYRIDNVFKFLFMNEEPIKYFQELIFHDAIFKELQYPAESTLLLLKNLLKNQEEKIIDLMNMNLTQFLFISRAIVNYCTEQMKLGPSQANLSITPFKLIGLTPKKFINIDISVINRYFEIMASTEPLNTQFDHPMSMKFINSDSAWLIPVTKDNPLECYLPVPPISSWGLYDRIMSLLNFPNVGSEFEDCIQEWFEQAFRTKVYTGKYIFNGTIYDSDGILLIENLIILTECKTKPMQRVSRSGHIGQLIIDMGKAFLYSTMQAYRCEAAFRAGKIELYPSNSSNKDINKGKVSPSHILQLPDNPQFIRISCTTFNFGTLIEKAILENLLLGLMNYNYGSEELSVNSSLEKIKQYQRELHKIWNSLKPYYGDSAYDNLFKKLTHFTALMPFGLIYLLTNGASDREEAMRRLKIYFSIQVNNYNVYESAKYLIGINKDKKQ